MKLSVSFEVNPYQVHFRKTFSHITSLVGNTNVDACCCLLRSIKLSRSEAIILFFTVYSNVYLKVISISVYGRQHRCQEDPINSPSRGLEETTRTPPASHGWASYNRIWEPTISQCLKQLSFVWNNIRQKFWNLPVI